MFEQSLMDLSPDAKNKKTGASLIASFGIQALMIVALLLVPIINYYELPATDLVTFLAAPPPPPPPPPPPAAVVEVVRKVVPREFDAGKLTQPKEIPDEIAIIKDEDTPPPATIAGVVGGVPGGMEGGSVGGVIGGIISSTPSVAPPPPPPPPKKVTPSRITVGGNVAKARLVRQVRPTYPPLARQARIQGKVMLKAVIGRDGKIQELEVISGHPLLIPNALNAVKQWQYKPTLLNNTPVEVQTQIEVNFTLSG